MSTRPDFDFIVLGSGFGGSLLATILSRHGMSVAMVDRARHPRFAIGESSTPAADLLLQQLALRHQLPEMLPLARFGSWREAYPQLNCGCKRGFSYVSHLGAGYSATSDHQCELLVAANASREVADTHWYRAHVDAFLACVAENRGVTALDGCQVTGFEHPEAHHWTIVFDQNGCERRLHTPFLIDASGPAGVLANWLGIPDTTDVLRTRTTTVYGHWLDVRPLSEWFAEQGTAVEDFPYPVQDSTVHHLFDDGWLWQIPFEDGTTSLGYVFADSEAALRAPTAADIWAAVLRDRPILLRILGDARLAESPGTLVPTGRLQRLQMTAAGADWAALPHTAGFIDPLHSTGIAHTLSGIARLGNVLLESVERTRAAALEQYSRAISQELRLVDRLVSGCYDALCDFRLFTTWSMAYFAAATTFERRQIAESCVDRAFLGADDSEFVQTIGDLSNQLRSICNRRDSVTKEYVDEFVSEARERLAPYNHVGLFEPERPNMYRHTAVAK